MPWVRENNSVDLTRKYIAYQLEGVRAVVTSTITRPQLLQERKE